MNQINKDGIVFRDLGAIFNISRIRLESLLLSSSLKYSFNGRYDWICILFI